MEKSGDSWKILGKNHDTVQLTTNISCNITNANHITTTRTLAHQPPYACWHTNHVTLVAMSPTLVCQPRNPSQHATQASTLPTQARYPCHRASTLARHQRHPHQHATDATHASIPPMPPTLARHPCKHANHATHASTCSTPFLKFLLKSKMVMCWINTMKFGTRLKRH